MIDSGGDPLDVIVIGGGMAGLSAAYHAAALGASAACIEPALYGGLVASVGELDDFPFPAAMPGASLADAYVRRASEVGVRFIQAESTGITATDDGVRIQTDSGTYDASKLILASGARLRKLGLPREEELAKRGISDCAWCDGGLYRGQSVAVIGGGDSALQAALHLAKLCDRVTLIVRGSSLRARRRYVLLAADNTRIEFVWESVVDAFVGEDSVTGVRVRNIADGRLSDLSCACVFVYAGLNPANDFVPSSIRRDPAQFIVTASDFQTSMPNVYAVGALRSGCGGGIASALGDGAAGAAAAVRSLEAADD